MPLPAPDPDEVMPADLQQLAGYMRQRYSEATQWWEFTSSPALQDTGLPDDLLDDAAAAEPAAVAIATDEDTGNEASPCRTPPRPRNGSRTTIGSATF